MLNTFRAAKAAEIERLLALDKAEKLPDPWEGERPDFIRALWDHGPGAVIAEYKRASPSKGDINLSVTPEEAALAYKNAGAAALSVLTEETHFKGHLDFLARMHPVGSAHAAQGFHLAPAADHRDAQPPRPRPWLLIARMLGEDELDEMIDLAQVFGLSAVVEVFDEDDLAKALACDPEIIQVNNRDLSTCPGHRPERLPQPHSREGPKTNSGSAPAASPPPKTRPGWWRQASTPLLVGTSLMSGGRPGGGAAEVGGEIEKRREEKIRIRLREERKEAGTLPPAPAGGNDSPRTPPIF